MLKKIYRIFLIAWIAILVLREIPYLQSFLLSIIGEVPYFTITDVVYYIWLLLSVITFLNVIYNIFRKKKRSLILIRIFILSSLILWFSNGLLFSDIHNRANIGYILETSCKWKIIPYYLKHKHIQKWWTTNSYRMHAWKFWEPSYILCLQNNYNDSLEYFKDRWEWYTYIMKITWSYEWNEEFIPKQLTSKILLLEYFPDDRFH